jgi:tol-pal system protein YbgF
VHQKKNAAKLSTLVTNQADIKNEIDNLGITLENLTAKSEESSFFSQKVLTELEQTNKRINDLYKLAMESNLQSRKRSEDEQKKLHTSIADLENELDEIKSVLDELKKEKKKTKLAKAKAEKAKKDKEKKLAELKKKEAARAKAEKEKRGKTIAVPKSIKQEDLYQSAYTNFMGDNFAQAQLEFSVYIKRFPNTELAANSLYWTGEAHLKLGERKKAIDTFLKYRKKYPDSEKAPSALLRAAELYGKMKNPKKAEDTYKKIRDNYPDSLEANTAFEELTKIDKRKKK